jgi:hypothetical protein
VCFLLEVKNKKIEEFDKLVVYVLIVSLGERVQLVIFFQFEFFVNNNDRVREEMMV